MYVYDILCGISKVPFEIPHRISYPYIERYDFYTTLKFWGLLDLRAHTRFWNAPWPFLVVDLGGRVIVENILLRVLYGECQVS